MVLDDPGNLRPLDNVEWRQSEPARLSGRGLESIGLHYAGRVNEGDDGEDDVLRERTPGRTKACETDVNRCQIMQIGAWVALLRRCYRETRNS
jgi:hypothetical protein